MRLIIDEAQDAYTNMATDEAIMLSKTPTLRLYEWNPPAVSIGYFQSLEAEVDKKACEDAKVDIVRRITGGGAVFHDKELTYSIIIPEDMTSPDIIKSYEQICGTIVSALKSLNINAQFIPINDIIANKKKISGSAQTRKHGMVLQHGTILLDVDVKKMFSILKVPDEKMKDKIIKAVEERVDSIDADIDELKTAIIKSFEETFEKTKISELTADEQQLKAQLRQKFQSNQWNSKR